MTNLLALPAGTELAGDFKIKRVIGAGGFGITYLAEEQALARQVTIKEYFPSDFAARKNGNDAGPRSRECASDYKWGLERFLEEAQTLAKFNHPNIVRVYRYFRANSTGYMVLHFEEGANFKGWLKALGRAPRQAELDAIVEPLLEALAVIHKGDFLHRDIAPDNIIIRKDKTPVLIDFGSARGDIASHSRTVSALVKPGYSPYEQYASTSRQQGPWTDIYALGATFYQAITGKRPPDAPSRMVKDEYVPARDAALGSYRAGFLAAIDKSLRLEVSERPQSIAEWRGQLLAPDQKPAKTARGRIGDVLGLRGADAEPVVKASADAILPPPPDAPQPKGQLLDFIDGLKDAKPGEGKAGNGKGGEAKRAATVRATPAAQANDVPVAAALAPVAESAAGVPHGLGYGPAPVGPLSQRLKEVVAPAAASVPKVYRDAASQKRAMPIEDIPPPVVLPRPIERRDPLRQKRRWFFLRPPWRGLLFKAAVAIGVASALVLYQDRLPHSAPPVPQKGSQQSMAIGRTPAAAPRSEGTSVVLPAPQALTGHAGAVTAAMFVNQGRRVVSAGADSTVRIWDATSGAPVKLLKMQNGAPTALAVNDALAVTGHADGSVALWDLETAQKIAVFKRGDAAISGVAFGAEPGHLLAASTDGKIALWLRQTPGQPATVVDAHEAAVLAIQRVSDRDLVASIGTDRVLRLSRSESLTAVRSYRGSQANLTALGVSADGRTVAAAAEDGQVRLWSTSSSRLVKSFKSHDGGVAALAFAPNGGILASADSKGDVRVWDGKKGKLLASFAAGGGVLRVLNFAQDGRRIVTAGDDGTLKIWDAAQVKLARD